MCVPRPIELLDSRDENCFLALNSLSPLLFNLYISDLKAFLGLDDDTPKLVNSRINCLMYADDLILMSRSETGLQALLDRLGEYCGKRRMEVNIEKTKAMKFSGNGVQM